MFCMKCGREITGEQVFCEDCRLEMEKYPVRPGTVVQLPRRSEQSVHRKPPKRRMVSAEEQVRTLRKWVRSLVILVAICFALIAALIYPAAQYLLSDHFEIGQNYSVITSTEETETTQPEP